jgi:hypothetical protein
MQTRDSRPRARTKGRPPTWHLTFAFTDDLPASKRLSLLLRLAKERLSASCISIAPWRS